MEGGMVAPLEIWTTGAPVPGAQRARGTFFDMIARHTRSSFSGEHLNTDVTTVTSKQSFAKLLQREKCGVIVTGSPAHVRQNEDWMKWTMDALLELSEQGTPILGICFGHQLLGKAWGGVVDYNPRGREIGTYPLTFHAADPLLESSREEPVVVMTHLDSVVSTPGAAQVIAATALERHAALRFSPTTWGVQFHPEMDTEIVAHYLEERLEVIRAEGIDPDAVRGGFRDSGYGRDLLRNFARFCRNGAQF